MLAARGLAVAAAVRGARQHAVFGRDPALAAAALAAGSTFWSSTVAVHSTLVLPNSMSTEPSACMVNWRVMRSGRNWCGGTLAAAFKSHRDRWALPGLPRNAGKGAAANGLVDFGNGALDGFVVQVIDQAINGARLDGGGKHIVADAVGGDTLGGLEGVGVSHSMATTVTLSLLSPALRKASSTSSGTACETV